MQTHHRVGGFASRLPAMSVGELLQALVSIHHDTCASLMSPLFRFRPCGRREHEERMSK